MLAKLDEFGILDVIVVDDYWNRKVLHGLEIEQRAVYVVGPAQAPHCVQLSSLQAGCCMGPGRGHYLTYYVLVSAECRAHQPAPRSVRTKRLRANFLKNSIIRSMEQPGPDQPVRPAHHNLVRIFSFSDYVKICKYDISGTAT